MIKRVRSGLGDSIEHPLTTKATAINREIIEREQTAIRRNGVKPSERVREVRMHKDFFSSLLELSVVGKTPSAKQPIGRSALSFSPLGWLLLILASPAEMLLFAVITAPYDGARIALQIIAEILERSRCCANVFERQVSAIH
jgi:hypothetical protein